MIVPIVFLIISIIGSFFTGLSYNFMLNEVIIRLARNLVLVLSLIPPIITGMGLNFGIVLGAMAGQIGLIVITNYSIGGGLGLFLSFLIATPVAILFGYLVGRLLNKAKGREMITSMILGFFASGLYQLIFLVLAGSVIPFRNEDLLLTSGTGLRNTIDLSAVRQVLDKAIPFGKINIGFFQWLSKYPVTTLLLTLVLYLLLNFVLKTKLGQEMRAVGQDMHIAEVAGINVDRTRIIAVIISTVLAAWGQIMFLQNIGTINTFNSHSQVGLFAVASILVGGASVNIATWKEALVGTFLFHFLFIISPLAGQNLLGNAQIGEFFRVFVAYGVIGISLLLHAWEEEQSKSSLGDI